MILFLIYFCEEETNLFSLRVFLEKHLYLIRSILDASLAAPPDQFAHLTMTVNHVSEVQTQNTYRVSILENKERVSKCQAYEEKEGRINTDLAHHFVIIGGTFVPAGPDMQPQLVQRVMF